MIALDLSLASSVNAAGALLFVLEGVAILALGKHSRLAIMIGLLALTYGLTYLVQNILLFDMSSGALEIMLAGATVLAAVALAVETTPRGRPTRIVAVLGTAAALVIIFVSATDTKGPVAKQVFGVRGPIAEWATTANLAVNLAVVLLVAALALRMRAQAPPEQKAIAYLTLAFGLWAAFTLSAANTVLAQLQPPVLGVDVVMTVYSGILLIAVACLIPRPREGSRPTQRMTLLALVAGGLAGTLAGIGIFRDSSGYGSYGIVRTIGAIFLALAVLQHDLLGVPLPRIAVQRGALATGALALLLIVAQVAQNFLAAQYGLLMGGIVAGAFLFAAAPLQRAMESLREHTAQAPRSVRNASGRGEESYRKAVRWALRDHKISREEEKHLHELARDLGIDGVRAHEILIEVEQEERAT